MVPPASKPAEETFSATIWRFIIPPALVAVALLLIALLAAQNLILPLARELDLQRTAADLELARSIFESNERQKPAPEILRDLRKNEFRLLQLLPASTTFPSPNPRYISPGSFTEGYTAVHDKVGKRSGVLYLRRPAPTTRLAVHTIRAASMVGLLSFGALLLLTGFTLDRSLLRRLRKLAANFRARVPQKSWIPPDDQDAVNLLSASAEAFASHQQQLSNSLQSLLDQHAELYCRLAPDGRILEMNLAFRRFFEEEDPEAANFADLVHPTERAAVLQHLAQLHPKYPETDFAHRGKETPHFWLRWEARAVISGNGSIIGYKLFGHDITREKNHANEATELRQTLEQMESSSHSGMLRWNLATDTFHLSPGAARLLALPRGRDMSMNDFIAHLHPDDREGFRQALQTARSTGQPLATSLRPLTHPDRNTRLDCSGEVRIDPFTKLPTDISCILQTSTDRG